MLWKRAIGSPIWVEAVCDTYVQLECDTPKRDASFHGTIEANQLATLGLSRVTSSPQWVRRTPAKIARATEDYFLVSIQTKGSGKIVQDGRVAELVARRLRAIRFDAAL